MEDKNNIKDVVEVEAAEEQYTAPEAAAVSKKDKKDSWWNRNVTGKVLTIALAIAILLNAGIMAGMNAAFSKGGHDMNGGPSTEMQSGGPGGQQDGQMTPPGGGPSDQSSQNSGQNTPPENNQSSQSE